MNSDFLIQQFEDKSLSHYAYAIVSDGAMILIDPARDPQPYYDFAEKHHAKITGVIETHPHADFVSSHKEISQTTGAIIYVSKLVAAAYRHQSFDEGDTIPLGSVKLKALNTPGHSPDSISIVLESEDKDIAVFTGDTLFIGDCGRPDLRENTGNIRTARKELAKAMFHSLRNKLMTLSNNVLVYPAHGAGTLCGKALSEANSSTIGAEKISNWSLQAMSEHDFIAELITDQPFVPKYFEFDVVINKNGAGPFQPGIGAVPRLEDITCDNYTHKINNGIVIIDTRPEREFKKRHFANSFNIQNVGKFETWLGSIIAPGECFYLTAGTLTELNGLIERIAKIGYETQVAAAFVGNYCATKNPVLDFTHFKIHQEDYTIVDVRNTAEVKEKTFFLNAINIPLPELRERLSEIPTDKPVLIHCAGGYRSAIGSSIVQQRLQHIKVYDLSDGITTF